MISLCLAGQGEIQRRSLVETAEKQVRRGQIRRRSLDEVCGLNPAGCLARLGYIHPGIQGGPGQIGVLHSDWSRNRDAVDAVGARRSEDTPLGVLLLDPLVPGRFPGSGEFLLAVGPGRVAALASWKAEFLLADDPGWVAGPATQDAEFPLVEDPGCFCLRRRGRNLLFMLARGVLGRRIFLIFWRGRGGQVAVVSSGRRSGVRDPVQIPFPRW